MPIDIKKALRWMKRELAELKSYSERETSKGIPELNRVGLAAYSAGRAPIGEATVGLRYLGGYRSVLGCLQVLQGDERGFAEIDLAYLYKYWAIRILVRAYELDTQADKQARVLMETVAPCWMHATAVGADHIRNWLDGLIAKIHAGDQSVTGKDMNPLCTLMAHFVLQQDPKSLAASGWGAIDIYGPVATRTNTPPDYDEFAVYHTRAVDGAGFAAFHSYPYRVVPFELFAIAKLTGSPIAGCQHPLLLSPLARVRNCPFIAPTEELQAVLERANEEFDIGIESSEIVS